MIVFRRADSSMGGICGAQPSGSGDHGEGWAAVQGADVVHIWVDVGVWGAEGGL